MILLNPFYECFYEIRLYLYGLGGTVIQEWGCCSVNDCNDSLFEVSFESNRDLAEKTTNSGTHLHHSTTARLVVGLIIGIQLQILFFV